MRTLLLLCLLSISSFSFAECTSGCNITPSDSNSPTPPPNTYSNLRDVQPGGIFSQAQEAVIQCRANYAVCVAPGPTEIDRCAPILEDCIKRAQANLPQ